MRRTLALSVLFGSVVAGVGCKHIAGKSDCTYDPSDAILPGPSNPYFPGATFSGPVPPAAPKSDAAVEPAPPAADPIPAPKKAAPKDAPPSKISLPEAEPTAPVTGTISLPAVPALPFGN